ncbi:MAG: family 78 glycoside hydrolase catalytic domain, partial [Candidatus Hydrogenedentes bacterium]|nr:family 78 glycoside hydrolase catalytic domain [Candidatus Hydrogenedentota bacterium]
MSFMRLIVLVALTACSFVYAEAQPMVPKALKCEYRVDPAGVDAAPPRLSWTLESDERGARQHAYQVLVASTEAALSKDQGDLWDSGRVTSADSALVSYAGKPLPSRQKCYWKARVWSEADREHPGPWSAVARWSIGLLNPSDWQCAYVGMDPANGDPNFPWLRKTFSLDAAPEDARVYVNSLGYYELYVNGAKIDEHPFSPAATQLSKRSYYLVHDVTRYLKPGKNCIALWLGRGWYLPDLPGVTRQGPVVRAQLEITGPAGKAQTIGTGADWNTRASSITAVDTGTSGHYGGERVDAAKHEPLWADAGLDDSAWPAAQVVDVPAHTVCAQRVGPNLVQKRYSPRVIRPFGEKTWLVDFGTNLTGSFDIRFKAPKAGEEVAFDYYDRIVEREQLRNFSQHDVYVSDGAADGHFATRFNYHAYRYVRITGLEAPPREDDVSAALIHSDGEPLSAFACSNSLLNDIHDMVFHTFRCLSLGGFLVDCPHIERLGYGGDGLASTPTALTMFNMGALYTGWIEDWRDCQREDGDMPHTAPNPWNAGGGPFWCSFIIGASSRMATLYNDRGVLDANYAAMQRWLDGWVESNCKDGLLMGWDNKPYRNWYLGDWAQPSRLEKERQKSTHLVNNCVRIQSYDAIAKIAAKLGKDADAKRYQAKADALRPKVHTEFYDAEHDTYADDTQ